MSTFHVAPGLRCKTGFVPGLLLVGLAAGSGCATSLQPESPGSPSQAPSVESPSAPAAGESASPEAGDLRAEAERLNRILETRYAAGDLAGVAAMYADNAIMLGPDGYRVEGRDAIDAYWTRITNPVSWKLEVIDAEGGRGLIHQRGVSVLTYGRDTGEVHTSTVQFVLVWVRQPDGEYRIGMDAYW